jgi:hypothetical protein
MYPSHSSHPAFAASRETPPRYLYMKTASRHYYMLARRWGFVMGLAFRAALRLWVRLGRLGWRGMNYFSYSLEFA